MSVHFFTASDGARIAYRDEGTGRAVLCLAGLTRNGTDYDYLAAHLLPEHRLVRMDYRGRGDSEWTGAGTYTVPQEAQDVLALLDHLGLDRVPIIGSSRGGLVGMFLAAVARRRLAGLCLNDVGPVLEPAGLDRIKDYLGRNPAAQDFQQAALALERFSAGCVDVPSGRWLEEARRHFRNAQGAGLAINYDPALRDAFLSAFDGPAHDLWPLFDAAKGLPLALLRGANSDLLSVEAAAEMQHRRPDMIYAEIPGRAHIPFLDEPEALSAIRKWLDLVQYSSPGHA